MNEARPSLARGAAATTVATALSRVTGFVRVVVVAAAMGTTFLANTYQTANTAPNIVFELLAAGVLTSVFVPTFVDHLVRGEREEGWRAANALASAALVALVGLAIVLALVAPYLMRLLTLGVEDASLRAREIELGSTFLRLFAPQIAFYGAGMIMTGALHAHRKFVLAALAPIFNNIVVIAVYVTYALMRGDDSPTVSGISSAETLVLGLGTTLGVVAMTVVLIPQLRGLGWRFRFRFEPRHPAVRRGVRLGSWALGYAGGYQAGLVVVLVLANAVEGGVAAYQWAYTFFYLPHALFAVPIFNVLFTVLAEHAARREPQEVAERLRDGLAMLVFILAPLAAVLLALGEPLARVTLEYGVMTGTGARLVGRVLQGFAIGLPTYSMFLVLTRAFYAVGDTKIPALVNAGTVVFASAVGAALFFTLPEEWSVAGLALGHSAGFALGSAVLTRSFARRVISFGGPALRGSALRASACSLLTLLAAAGVRVLAPPEGRLALVGTVAVGAALGGLAYLGVMALLRSPELARVAALARRTA